MDAGQDSAAVGAAGPAEGVDVAAHGGVGAFVIGPTDVGAPALLLGVWAMR